jgi:predicted NUDIX family NTP pyrophosphohydrolase
MPPPTVPPTPPQMPPPMPPAPAARARSRRSCGLLPYRRQPAGSLEVLLVHPGGPYWARRDAGAWSIPKGEQDPGEQALQTARREFSEETGWTAHGPFLALTPVRQPGGKWVSAWAIEAPMLDPAQLRSNRFVIEWPPRSGVQREFPEVDRAAWFPLAQAQQRLIAGQRPLLLELAARLAQGLV